MKFHTSLPTKSHSFASPSGWQKWMNCKASAMMERDINEPASEAAEEGTKAHRILYRYLSIHYGAPSVYTEEDLTQYGKEMYYYVKDAVNVITELIDERSELYAEYYLDMSDILRGFGGTCDVAVRNNKTINVIDLKFGMGQKVYAKENVQMLLYAYGFLCENLELKDVTLTILQPRLGHVDSVHYTRKEVFEFMYGGKNAVIPTLLDVSHKIFEPVTGSHCKYCKAKKVCKAYLNETVTNFDQMLNAQMYQENPYGLLTYLYLKLKQVTQGVDFIKNHVEGTFKNGGTIEGLKAVQGAGRRVVKDSEGLKTYLVNQGFEIDEIVNTKLKTFAELDKLGVDYSCFVEKKHGIKIVGKDEKGEEINNPINDFF